MTIKRLADELSIAGQSLPYDDIMTYLLSGLGLVYDSLVSLVSHRVDSLTLKDLYSTLLTCEARILLNNQLLSLPNALGNVATKQNFSRGQGHGNTNVPQGRGHAPFNSNRGSG